MALGWFRWGSSGRDRLAEPFRARGSGQERLQSQRAMEDQVAVADQTDLQVLRLLADMSVLIGGAARRSELVEYAESLGHSSESTYEILATLDRTSLLEAWSDKGTVWLRVTPAGLRALDDPVDR